MNIKRCLILVVLVIVAGGVSAKLKCQSGIAMPVQAEFQFPYKLTKSFDYSIAGFCAATNGYARFVLVPQKPSFSESQINSLNTNDIYFRFDVSATHQRSIAAMDWSNILGISFPALPLAVIPMLTTRDHMLEMYALYLEAFALNLGLNEIVKNSVTRPRPMLYNPAYSMEFKTDGGNDNLKSFYSAHTSNAFMSAVFISKIYYDLGGKHPALVTAATLTTAATIGYLRYACGKHFPTDIITGAIIGSGIGYLIPAIHKKASQSNKVSFMPLLFDQNTMGIYSCYRF